MYRLAFQLLNIMLTSKTLDIHTRNNKILETAEGENAKLYCDFTAAPEDEGNLEIEWSVKSVRHPLDTAEIILYTAGQIYDQLYEPLKGRVYFHSVDPAKGDGAIHLSLLTHRDTGIYKCQVKKAPGLRSIKTVLRVLKRPSKPRCYYTEGVGEFGKTKVLHCRSQEGAAPIQYQWSRTPPLKLPTSAVMDRMAGTLTLRDSRESNTGTYKCSAINRVGGEECFLEMNLPDSPLVGMIAGAVTGSLIGVVVIASITCFIVRQRQRRDPETSNEIVEDASPPPPRRRSHPTCRKEDTTTVIEMSRATPV
ncbi:coxsackievirus and adenovirus receptor homolog [Toxotes jaculatrix]|uniref:coxsackievirus and adenovirus receptor homolog n=1 Tax=Toxotes jaculatrix TaxID=941984 RepID=UPI001B3AF13C|nr:coxsackievirus and adenovirus receptor homolog [Toxotes jaculatrix]XP_040897831.1 coxsackievirus and adenovirus receptor homolog [Toxotes jaculatrix]